MPHPVASPFTPELVVEAEWLMSQRGGAGDGPLCGALQSESRGGEPVWDWAAQKSRWLSSSIREKRARPHPVASPFTPELVVEAEWLTSQRGGAGDGPLCGGLQSESSGGVPVWAMRRRSSGGCRD
jgi:hypothetical protein